MAFGREEERQTEEALDFTAPTTIIGSAKEMPSANPTPFDLYSTVLSSIQVHSTPTTTLSTVTNSNADFHNKGLHYPLLANNPSFWNSQHFDLVHSTMPTQTPISTRTIAASAPFNTQIDPSAIEFLKKKLSASQLRQNNTRLRKRQGNPYV